MKNGCRKTEGAIKKEKKWIKLMKSICTYKHKHESQMQEVSSSMTTKMTSLSINEIIPNER